MALTLNIPVLIRGGGEMASGIAHRLHQCHMNVLLCEIAAPTAVRRSVASADAVFKGRQTIEGLDGGVETRAGMKLGDVDPRGERGYVDTISDKARAIGGGVLEAIFHSYRSLKIPACPVTINCKG